LTQRSTSAGRKTGGRSIADHSATSSLHYRNKVRENGFRIYSEKIGFENTPRSSVFDKELGISLEPYDAANREITFDPKTKLVTINFHKPRIEVHYLNTASPIKSYEDIMFPVSWLEMKSGFVQTDSSGAFFGPENIVGSGYMNSLRIGDMLPNDFQPGQAGGLLKEKAAALPPDLGDLRERVYLTTDKPYYYRGISFGSRDNFTMAIPCGPIPSVRYYTSSW